MLPLVTVAVLAYNRREELEQTLEILRGSLDWPRDRLQIVVVDNASEDGTAAMLRERFADVELIENAENEGIGGWNRAFAAARGDWVLVLDDDCHVSGDALERALAGAAEHDAQMVSFGVDSSVPGVAFSDVYRTGLLSFWGCAVLVRRDALGRLGGFDARLFIWCHELDFTMRFLDAGLRHLTMPEIRAVHMKPVPPVAYAGHMRNMHNWGFVAGKLLRPRDAAVAAVNLVARSAIEAFRYHAGFIAGGPAVLRGLRAGVRVREPVRPAVSRLYRRQFIDFTSQVRAADRVRHLLRPRVPNYREQFCERRPRLYPHATAALRIP